MNPTILFVPGLRDNVADHWQTLLADEIPGARTVAPLERDKLSCAARVAALDSAVREIEGPIVLFAHSAGCLTVVHWAKWRPRPIAGAILATPADIETPLPDGYPTRETLQTNGWLPVPKAPLPFPTLVGASRNDPLAAFEATSALAQRWAAKLVDLGEVGHLNPASGYGAWPAGRGLIARLLA